MAVKLGQTYTDSITGFSGVAVAKTEFLHGCVRVSIQPKELREGKPIDPQVFDEQQLVGVDSPAKAGGPGDPLPRAATAGR
jgi:hypothetical protein